MTLEERIERLEKAVLADKQPTAVDRIVKPGDRFLYVHTYDRFGEPAQVEVYMVARTNMQEYCLISLSSGNRWTEPVHVSSSDSLTLSALTPKSALTEFREYANV